MCLNFQRLFMHKNFQYRYCNFQIFLTVYYTLHEERNAQAYVAFIAIPNFAVYLVTAFDIRRRITRLFASWPSITLVTLCNYASVTLLREPIDATRIDPRTAAVLWKSGQPGASTATAVLYVYIYNRHD